MCRKTADAGQTLRGFTLMELMLVLLILGIVLGLGVPWMQGGDSSLDRSGSNLLRLLSEARTDAILSRAGTAVVAERGRLYVETKQGRRPVDALADGVSLRFFSEAMRGEADGRIAFSPSGVSGECLLLLSWGGQSLSLYVPPVGGALMRFGEHDLEELRQAHLAGER